MVEDEGLSQAEVDAPYFTTCGEPIKKEVKLNKEEISWLKSIGLK